MRFGKFHTVRVRRSRRVGKFHTAPVKLSRRRSFRWDTPTPVHVAPPILFCLIFQLPIYVAPSVLFAFTICEVCAVELSREPSSNGGGGGGEFTHHADCLRFAAPKPASVRAAPTSKDGFFACGVNAPDGAGGCSASSSLLSGVDGVARWIDRLGKRLLGHILVALR